MPFVEMDIRDKITTRIIKTTEVDQLNVLISKTRSHCGKMLHKIPSTQTPEFIKAKQQHPNTK
jgi:hypothetical protein